MMTAEHPVQDLMKDHRLIEKVMTALQVRLQSSEGKEFPAEFVERALAFFVEYADGFHHFKEEEALFPAMGERGVPVEGGPIGMMLHEHTLGRKCLAGIREQLPAAKSGDEAARASLTAYAGQYVELLRQHIWKEDNILFRMAEQALEGEGADEVMQKFRSGAHRQVTAARTEELAQFAAGL
jgi:hemerythrin-like domain-containing protein